MITRHTKMRRIDGTIRIVIYIMTAPLIMAAALAAVYVVSLSLRELVYLISGF